MMQPEHKQEGKLQPRPDTCPVCNMIWAYDVNGKTYYHTIGIYDYDSDRTIAWTCPNCRSWWER